MRERGIWEEGRKEREREKEKVRREEKVREEVREEFFFFFFFLDFFSGDEGGGGRRRRRKVCCVDAHKDTRSFGCRSSECGIGSGGLESIGFGVGWLVGWLSRYWRLEGKREGWKSVLGWGKVKEEEREISKGPQRTS